MFTRQPILYRTAELYVTKAVGTAELCVSKAVGTAERCVSEAVGWSLAVIGRTLWEASLQVMTWT